MKLPTSILKSSYLNRQSNPISMVQSSIYLVSMVAFFAFTSFHPTLRAQDQIIEQIVATVGNDIILKSDIETQYYQALAQNIDFDGDLKCTILEDLLVQKLLLNQAKLDSVDVSEKEVEQRVDARLSMLVAQAGDEKTLTDYLGKDMKQIKQDLNDLLYDQLLTQKMEMEITSDLKITPSEVRAYYRDLPENEIPLINSELELAHITIQPTITDEAIQEVKDRLNDIIQRVNQGTRFSTLAVLYSEDPGSAKNGGELGFRGRKDFVPEFSAVAFQLKQPGEISPIVESPFGYHIIQLIEQRGEKANFRHILLTPKTPFAEIERAINTLDSLANEIRKETITFEEAAVKFSHDEDTKNNGGTMINPNTGLSKFEADELGLMVYKQIKDLKIGEISEPFESRNMDNKQVYEIVKVISKSEPHLANIKDDYQFLQDMALAEKKDETMRTWISKKQRSTYIKINETYHSCPFNYEGWIK